MNLCFIVVYPLLLQVSQGIEEMLTAGYVRFHEIVYLGMLLNALCNHILFLAPADHINSPRHAMLSHGFNVPRGESTDPNSPQSIGFMLRRECAK